jgi:TatD DNase family protein
MTLFETHAHINDSQFDLDRQAVLDRAREAGVKTVIEIAESPECWGKAAALAETSSNPKIFWACGFHPHYAERQENFDFKEMKKSAENFNCLAVGEIGLDYAKSEASKDNQQALFRKTLEIAGELDKPVVIHCRDAQQDTLRILRSFFSGLARYELPSGVIHCFSGDLSFAEGCLDLGFYLGVDGPVTYPSAQGLREVLSKIPLERLVLETDCPYLPPQAFRGKRNEPAYLTHITEKLSEIFGKSSEEISQVTAANSSRLFRIKN